MFLDVVAHPPDLFYNDPKSQSFDVVIALRGEGETPEADSAWEPVGVELLYERGELVDNQAILEFVGNPGRVKLHESTAFRFRINQVSRNHLNRRFRLRFTLQGNSEVKIQTGPVMVLSKEASKRSRGRNKSGATAPNKRIRHSVEVGKQDKWVTQACHLFKDIAWQKAGYEFVTDASGNERLDKNSPIYRCVCCGAMSGERGMNQRGMHHHTCALNSLLSNQNHTCEPPPNQIQHLDLNSRGLDNSHGSDTVEDDAARIADAISAPTMAKDLQEILNIPAASFTWLDEELEDEDKLFTQFCENTNSAIESLQNTNASPAIIR
jgi:hypothetical protein